MSLLINGFVDVNGATNYGQLTQTLIDALTPVGGDQVFNTTVGEQQIYAPAHGWVSVTSGSVGPQGPQGPQGIQGVAGTAATIAVGSVSTLPAGSSATISNVGSPSAAVFDFGLPTGPQGIQGEPGTPGATGNTGAQGPQGPAGADGDSATVAIGTVTGLPEGSNPYVQNVGTLNDSILNFGLVVGATGSTGPQGVQGISGVAGQAATVTIGSVTALATGSTPTVENVGTATDAILNWGLVTGATGSQGIQGVQGAKGDAGTAGVAATIAVGSTTTTAAGTSASVSNSGSSSAAVFDFSIPRGDTGAAGANGINGVDSTIAVGTVTTGAAGTAVEITNSGSPSSAVFDFTIPRGDTGATGAQGEQGIQGNPGPQGPAGNNFLTISDVSTSQTITVDTISRLYLATGTITLTLPSPFGIDGNQVYVKNIGSNIVTLSGTIDGAASMSLSSKSTAHLVASSTNSSWYVL